MFFKRNKSLSRDIARERLENVMLQERLDIPPQLIEDMKTDIVTVLQKYVPVNAGDFSLKWSRDPGTAGKPEIIELIAGITVPNRKTS